MPGLFGAVGLPDVENEALASAFGEAWEVIERTAINGGVLGGHAHRRHRSVVDLPEVCFAVDGEGTIYHLAGQVADGRANALFELTAEGVRLSPGCRGNVAVVDRTTGFWHLATEWTGSFPLYYAHRPGRLLFGSRLRNLKAVWDGPHDPLALVAYMRKAYFEADRSLLAHVKRLQPGQRLVYDPCADRLRIDETSRIWAGWEALGTARMDDVVAQSWNELGRAVTEGLAGADRSAMMISGGWDSRTLLSAVVARLGTQGLQGYSHGDAGSRELRIAQRVAETAGVPWRQEPIDATLYDLESLQRGFQREEHVVFPHWQHAGEVLAGLGLDAVTAGVYGEVIGGHYGRAMLLQGRRKIAEVGTTLLGLTAPPSRASGADLERLYEFLRIKRLGRPWYFRSDYWESIDRPVEGINADIRRDLDRLRARGVESLDQLIEAYVTEHRGSQYINAQLRSCRAAIDIALPFADRSLLGWSSRLPLPLKIHNAVNRGMLRRFAPAYLRFPLAATLVPARAPLLAQEASRLVRRLREDGHWRLHFRSGGRVRPPRLAWVNFEFLRTSRALLDLIADLRADIWDREALRRRVDAVRSGAFQEPVHPVSDLLLKIYTTDLLIRS